MQKRIVGVLIIAVFSTGQAWADMLFNYDLENHSTSGSTIAASDQAEHLTGSDLTAAGVNLLRNYGSGVYTASNWAQSHSPDAKKYFAWSVTPDEGYEISYDNIDLSLVRGNWRSAHGAESWVLRASLDGFESSAIDLLSWDISGSNYDEIQLFTDQDISALGTQSGTVSFRLYGFDADGRSDYSGLAYAHPDLSGTGTNLNIYGDVRATPEPMTIGLMTIGGAGLVCRRRKQN